MAARYIIGVDCSTTATKAVVWDLKGNAVVEGRATFPLSSPHAGWAEQNAEDWWRSTRDALREAAGGVDTKEIGAIGITHQRESFVCLDEHDRPIRPAILWLDARAGKQVAEHGSERVHELSGKPPNPTTAFYKMMWLRENEPDTLQRAGKLVDVHALLIHRLTKQWRTSWAAADPLGLVDMRTFEWSDELLGLVGLRREQMADIHAPGETLGELSTAVAAEVGIPAGTPVVAGSGDGQSAGLGANITRPGRAYLNLGTSVVSGSYSEHYTWSRDYRVLSGPIPRTYTLEVVLPAGTFTVSWFVNNFGGIRADELGLGLSAEQLLEAAAARVKPGAGGLFTLPYWGTAATPYWDAQAQGVTLGWNGSHTKAHFYRSILEGVAFEQRLMTDRSDAGLEQPVERFYAMGGGSRSPLWCQIIADVTQRQVVVCKELETTALGAAMHAGAAIGAFAGIREAADQMSGEGATYEPDEAATARYDRLYTDVYREIYPRVAPLYEPLDALKTEQGASLSS
jgi:xylulokinase